MRDKEQKTVLFNKINTIRSEEGLSVNEACKRAGVHHSFYYGRVRSNKRRTKATTESPEVPTTEESIPVILTRLTPSQLSAFMRGI